MSRSALHVVVVGAVLLTGCAPKASTDDAPLAGASRSTAPVDSDDPLGITRELNDLERQAEADAAWLEQRRQAAAERSAEAPPFAQPPPDIDGRRRRPEVFFNDPPATARAAEDRASGVLGRPEPEFGSAAESDRLPSIEMDEARDPDHRISIASDEFPLLLVRLRQELMAQSHRSSQPLRELIAMATMAIVDPSFRLEPDAFQGLTESERGQLRHFQSFFARLGRSLDGSAHADEVLIEAVSSLREALKPAPELIIRTAELCHSVEGFGRFTTFDPRRFLAMDEQEAIIYLEIEGLHATRNEGGDWVTRLSQEVQIFGARDRIPVWSEPWQSTVDRTANQRRDFYTVWLIRFPRALSTGEYFLKVRVRDDQTSAEAEMSITFEMVADPRMTGRPVRK